MVNKVSFGMKRITGAQMRAARAMLRKTAQDLAEAAKVGVMTIRRAEASDGEVTINAPNEAAIRAALEAAGVVFLDPNGNGPGVALSRPDPSPGDSSPSGRDG